MDGTRRLRQIEVVRDDEQILEVIALTQPALVAIDAPLGLPEGRCCTDQSCACASHGIMREVDRVCAAAGFRPFPTLLPSMVKLTERGIALHAALTEAGHDVIEVYPGMAQDVLGIPRKGKSVDGLRRGLKRAGAWDPARAARHSRRAGRRYLRAGGPVTAVGDDRDDGTGHPGAASPAATPDRDRNVSRSRGATRYTFHVSRSPRSLCS
jgi:predicted nuclease with RNAse H fold